MSCDASTNHGGWCGRLGLRWAVRLCRHRATYGVRGRPPTRCSWHTHTRARARLPCLAVGFLAVSGVVVRPPARRLGAVGLCCVVGAVFFVVGGPWPGGARGGRSFFRSTSVMERGRARARGRRRPVRVCVCMILLFLLLLYYYIRGFPPRLLRLLLLLLQPIMR